MGYGGSAPQPTWPSSRLQVPTYDGSGQGVHPSVVYKPEGWNGYRFWMAFTPFPSGQGAYENPSIVVSQDGLVWEEPAGIVNPISGVPAAGNYADTDLLIHQGTMYCFYVAANGADATAGNGLLVRSSVDGVTWSAATAAIPTPVHYEDFLSPAIVIVPGGFEMFSVKNVQGAQIVQRRTATNLLGPWSNPADVSLTIPGGLRPWHLDVLYEGGRYVMHLCDTVEGNRGGWLASSYDGLNWKVNPNRQGATTWATDVYRSSPVRIGPGHYGLWVGGKAAGNDWRIGFTTIPANAFPA